MIRKQMITNSDSASQRTAMLLILGTFTMLGLDLVSLTLIAVLSKVVSQDITDTLKNIALILVGTIGPLVTHYVTITVGASAVPQMSNALKTPDTVTSTGESQT